MAATSSSTELLMRIVDGTAVCVIFCCLLLLALTQSSGKVIVSVNFKTTDTGESGKTPHADFS